MHSSLNSAAAMNPANIFQISVFINRSCKETDSFSNKENIFAESYSFKHLSFLFLFQFVTFCAPNLETKARDIVNATRL